MDKKWIWIVKFPDEMIEHDCCWTKKEDAIKYVKNEAKDYEWKDFHLMKGDENSETDALIYEYTFEGWIDDYEYIFIERIYLDTNPFD